MPPRFYCSREILPGAESVELDSSDSRHLAKVLRLKQGDEIQVFDGAGRAYRALVGEPSPRAVVLRILEEAPNERPALRRLTIGFSLIRGEPMRWLVQKATELGVERLAPMASERTVRPRAGSAGGAASRADRWRRVSLAACKQCGRNRPIEISAPAPFESLVRDSGDHALRILAWEGGGARSLGDILLQRLENLASEDSILMAVGPEGGFSPDEHELAVAHGFEPAGLGPNILRAETAALAGAAMILGWPGDGGRK